MMGAIKMFQPFDMRPTVEITAFTMTSVSTLVVAIRFYCRCWTVNKLKLYDYIICASLLCTWALCVCNHYQLLFGSGAQGFAPNPLPQLTREQAEALMRYVLHGSAASWYAYHIGYVIDLCLIKLSILFFYLSFATHRTFRILVYSSMGAVAVVSIAMIFTLAFQCPKRPHYAVTPGFLNDRRSAYCFDLRKVLYWQAGFNLASDLLILVLPLPLLFRLRMQNAKRMLLLAVFSATLLVPIASGIRFWGLYLWANSGAMARYYGGYIIFWSQVELNTAIICASMPFLQPLFSYLFVKLSLFQGPRDARYYYGGERGFVAQPSTYEDQRPRARTFCSPVPITQPDPTYQIPKTNAEDESLSPTVPHIHHLTEESIIRDRVRAFANGSSPCYPPPPLRTHYIFEPTNR